MNFLQQLNTEKFALRPKLDGLHFKQISEMSKHDLEEKFSKEILADLRSCNGDKALGLDRFNTKFLQAFWPILKDDLVNVFTELHQSGNCEIP